MTAKPNKHMGDLLGPDAPEDDIQNAAMNRMVGRGCYYHMNPGTGYRSTVKNGIYRAPQKMAVAVEKGDIVIRKPVLFNSGVPEGFPDISGGTQYVVQPGDVGKTVLVFTGVEMKTRTGRVRAAQGPTLDMISRKGGIAGLARTPQAAIDVIDGWRP